MLAPTHAFGNFAGGENVVKKVRYAERGSPQASGSARVGALDAKGVIVLIVGKGEGELRNASGEGLGSSSNTSMVRNRATVRKNLLKGDLPQVETVRWERGAG